MFIRFLTSLLASALVAIPGTCFATAQPSIEQGKPAAPNILWITCEDITPTLGCYGDKVIHTPNIDWLASQGVRYTRAFSVAGVCAPSRHALITGMYPISTGAHHMRTLYNMVDGLPDYSVVLPEGAKCFTEWLRLQGYYCTNNAKTDYQFVPPPSAWDESDQDAHWRKRPEGMPFFSVFNFLTTHESRIWMQADEPLLIEEDLVPIPPYLPDTAIARRDVARKYSNIIEMDRQVGVILDQLREDGLLDSTIIFFFSDHGGMLPREKRELYDTGLQVPLIVRFPDQSRAGEVCEELVSFVDFAPTVLSLAGIKAPEFMQGQAFLGDYKSESPRTTIFAARDRMDTEYDRVRAARNHRYKYIRNFHPELPFVQKIQYREQIPVMRELMRMHAAGTLDADAALWWRQQKPLEELYDTETDPYELKDIAQDAVYHDALMELRNAMDLWLSEVGDLGAMPERELIYDYFWKGGSQPQTLPVSVETGKTPDGSHILLQFECDTPGASIVWRIKNRGNPDQWFLYAKELQFEAGFSGMLEVQSVRIGYQFSEILEVDLSEGK